jgi:hypothetical protein
MCLSFEFSLRHYAGRNLSRREKRVVSETIQLNAGAGAVYIDVIQCLEAHGDPTLDPDEMSFPKMSSNSVIC